MIQIKRGSKSNWLKLEKPLADGQPGYDKSKNKIKVGNGEDLWADLPYASGLFAKEVLCELEEAKTRLNSDSEDKTLITYGTTSPDENTIGQVYLQHYDTSPETDYIIGAGVDGIWTYQKWNSGIARCFGTFEVTTAIQAAAGKALYQNSSKIERISYPFTFKDTPSEIATVQSPGGLVWIAASKGLNTKTQTANYSLISIDKQTNQATYRISLSVEGFWE